MEKRTEQTIKRVVLIGPESTGKTELAEYLSKKFRTTFVPEYARSYVENLIRPYSYSDVEHIALKQLELEKEYEKDANNILFYDTFLIITKVWFDVVYNKRPFWIDKHIKNSKINLYLLCNTDLPWIDDPVRENGGKMREKLFDIYQKELDNYNFNYEIVTGVGEERYHNAFEIVNKFLEK